jgi:sialate O-acetylesterase
MYKDTTVLIDAPVSSNAFGPNRFIFGSNMVMACSDDHPEGARVFGKANVGETVTVTVVGASPAASAKAIANAGGNWSLVLHVKASLTSYNISVEGSNQTKPVVLTNVLFGDTYLCSGQSNMDFCLGGQGKCRGGAFSANESVANAKDFPEIRLGTGNSWSLSHDPTDPNDHALRSFSAVCYLTALHIKKVLARWVV